MTLLPPHLIAAAEDVVGMTRGHWIIERGSNPPRDPAVAAAACRLLGIEDLRQYPARMNRSDGRPYRETAHYVVRLADRRRLEVSKTVEMVELTIALFARFRVNGSLKELLPLAA